jgi:hypothetical protein
MVFVGERHAFPLRILIFFRYNHPMAKYTLSKTNIQYLVMNNKYSINENNKNISRCIDGRYENNEQLPALSIPGADAGQLAVIYSAATKYGFEVFPDKVYKSLLEVIGGVENFNFHSDSRSKSGELAAGCGHMTQIRETPKDYGIEKDFIKNINSHITDAHKEGA